jgi:RNA polymerase sporulation-specific sigma factor
MLNEAKMFLKRLSATFYYNGGNTFEQPLPAEEEKKLFGILKEKGNENEWKNAKDKLVLHNMRLVSTIAKNYNRLVSDMDREELIPYGTMGLIKAVDGYDEDKCLKFSYYASKCITNEMLMFLRKSSKHSNVLSLFEAINASKNDGNPPLLMDTIVSPTNVAEENELKILCEKITEFVEKLTDTRDVFIITHRLGLDNHNVLTQNEIAKMLNISRAYVSRIETALKKRIIDYLEIEYFD